MDYTPLHGQGTRENANGKAQGADRGVGVMRSVNWKFWQRKKPLVVLLATRNEDAIQAAAEKLGDSTRREAFTTGSAFLHITGCNLIVLDVSDLTETDDVTREALAAAAAGSGATVISGAAFAQDPIRYESQARLSVGDLRTLPRRSIAHVNYAGGVGKTTLALDLAAYFVRRTNLPAAVVELSQGASAFHALIDPGLPHFFDMLTQDTAPGIWRGVTLVPMVYPSARMLLDGNHQQAIAFIAAIQQKHMLTVFDVVAAHPLWPEVRHLVQQIYVVVSPRADSVLQGYAVVDELYATSAPPTPPVNGGGSRSRHPVPKAQSPRRGAGTTGRGELGGTGSGNAHFVANMVTGTSDRLALSSLKAAVTLPYIKHPTRYQGHLGRRLMPIIYPGWGRRGR